MRFTTPRVILHILVVAFIVLMPIVDAPSPQPTALLMLKNPFVEIDFVLHAVCVGFGYANYFYFIPTLFHHRRKPVYFALVLVIFIFLCFLPELLSRIPFAPFFEDQDTLNIHAMIQIRHIFFLYMVIFLFSLITWSEARRRNAEQEKTNAEMRFLKSQINPHFLFNTLNSIYAMVYVDPDKAGRSLIKMANIMRHTLNAAQVSYEPLQTTIDDLNDFVSLQRERFGDTVQVDYSVKIDRDDLVIAPLILTPFVENAFKYGIDPSHKSSIRITIYNDGADLCCVFVNTDFGYRPRPENSTGIGIANTRNRLDLVYPGKYVLDISAKDGLFSVKLAINLS